MKRLALGLLMLGVLTLAGKVQAQESLCTVAESSYPGAGWVSITCGEHTWYEDARVNIVMPTREGVEVFGLGSHQESFWLKWVKYTPAGFTPRKVLEFTVESYQEFWAGVDYLYLQFAG